jgi:hypothetical protein
MRNGMKILIAGQGKSGTTALYCALKQTLPPTYTYLFEPLTYTTAAQDRFVLAKVQINEFAKINDFDDFDRKIFIVRDPRDNLVSRLLYAIYNDEFINDDGKVNFFIERLEQKRKDPLSVSVVELLQALNELSGKDILGSFILRHQLGSNFNPLARGHFIYKYEHFVADQYSSLEKYLGFNLSFDGKVDAAYSRVARTKGSGDWRNWFTEHDVKYFRPIYHEFLARYEYDLAWTLNPAPTILPEHSTEYVIGLVRQARAFRASGSRTLPRRIIVALGSSLK